MSKRRLSLLIGMAMFLGACSSTSMSTVAQTGTLDLTHYSFEREGLVSLDGGWLLYWNRLLTPGDFAGSAIPVSDGSAWNAFET